ncbi:hypothetical protein B0H19DRAFT_1273642 [Mycena capillaripes]|nr:hypothetical protein B0H19DRAFT_1273642 [Mycena capillaripes]
MGLFCTATIGENLVVRDGLTHRETHHLIVESCVRRKPLPVLSTKHTYISVKEDKSLTPPQFPNGVHGFFDGRRVSALNQIILDVREE